MRRYKSAYRLKKKKFRLFFFFFFLFGRSAQAMSGRSKPLVMPEELFGWNWRSGMMDSDSKMIRISKRCLV